MPRRKQAESRCTPKTRPVKYTVVVKVIDILGNDTTKTLKVKVGG